MFEKLLDLIFPPKCILCGKLMIDKNVFSTCSECILKLNYNEGKRCRVCSTPLEILYGEELCHNCRRNKRYFEKAFAPFIYEDKVKSIIIRYKFHGKRSCAKPLAAFMFTDIKSNITEEIDMITFVPLHWKRYGERGYNQSELLAENLAKSMDKPLAATLKKIKNINPLSRTEHGKRSELVRGCFEVTADVKGKQILLVDDILTTGATANECAKMLKRAGAKKVFISVAAVTKL